MIERLRTWLIVSLITAVVWLFAEAESLNDVDIRTPVTLVASNPMVQIITDEGWEARVRVTLRGSNAGIAQAREFLEQGVTLPLPFAAGPDLQDTPVDLLESMQRLPELRQFGVTATAVVPTRVTVRVREMVTEELPIRVSLPGVEIDGTARVTPATLTVRMPSSLRESLVASKQWPPAIMATLPESALSSLPRGALVEREAELVVPDIIGPVTGAQIPTGASATINFSIRARSETIELRAPVQVLLPPIESGEWAVQLAGGDVLLDVTVTGSPEMIARLRDRTDRIVGVLALSSDDLASGAQSKQVGFALLREGAFTPVPEALKIDTPRRGVGFTARRLSTDASPATPE
jgi:hypothetical protein